MRLPSGSAAGTTPNSYITNAGTLTILTGLSVAADTVVLFANGTAIAQQQGAASLSFSVTAPSSGTVQYVAQAVDAAGNVSFFTASLNVTFDPTMVPPTVTLDPASQNANFGAGLNTTDNEVTLDGTAEAGATVTVLGAPLVTQADSNGNYTISGVPVVPGVNTIDVHVTDLAGNSADATLTVTMHNITPPAITMSLVNDTGFSSTDLWTNDPTTKVVVDDASPITMLQASVNGGAYVNVLSNLTGDLLTLNTALLTQINGSPLPDGQLLIDVVAGDSAGNVAQPDQLDILLTRTPPDASVAPSLLTASDTGADPYAVAPTTSDNTPEIRLFAARADMVTFYDGGTMIGQAYSTGVAEITTPILADGVHDITATIQDPAGNLSGQTPALVLSIYTTPPTVPTLTLDSNDQDPVRANYTTDTQVTLNGQTTTEAGEPPATVQLVGLGLTATAAANGNFTFTNVPLAVGVNTLTVQATDLAGNTSEFTLTLTRGQLLPPTINAQAVGGPVVRSAAVMGTVQGDADIKFFLAGFDNAAPLVNVLPDLMNGSFSFSADQLEEINGAPLSAGAHVLHLVATDSRGVVSSVTNVSFTLDLSAQGTVATAVTYVAATGLYQYSFTLSGPPGNGWAIDQLSFPVPAGALIENLVTPLGWSAVSTGGASGVVWQATDPAAEVGPGQQLGFGLSSSDAPGVMTAGLQAVNAQAGSTASVAAETTGPAAADGPAVPDLYSTNANAALNIGAAAGVLANDTGTGLSVTAFDGTSAWGVPVQVNQSNGSFTWTPGSRFSGLSFGETVIDTFSYTVTDSLGDMGRATVSIVVHGVETAPSAANVIPSSATPSLYVRANATTTIPESVALVGASDSGVNDVLSLDNVAATSTRWGVDVDRQRADHLQPGRPASDSGGAAGHRQLHLHRGGSTGRDGVGFGGCHRAEPDGRGPHDADFQYRHHREWRLQWQQPAGQRDRSERLARRSAASGSPGRRDDQPGGDRNHRGQRHLYLQPRGRPGRPLTRPRPYAAGYVHLACR